LETITQNPTARVKTAGTCVIICMEEENDQDPDATPRSRTQENSASSDSDGTTVEEDT